jgi:putative transposase
MANTFTSLHYHIIFSTKHREPWIREDAEARLWAYLAGIPQNNDCKPLLIGGTADHVHLLLGVPPTLALSEVLKRIKGGSSGWVKENIPGWQGGYGAFTVSKSQMGEVEDYIRNQREHHRVHSFQEEYRAFLDRHEIPYDEKYLWD